MSNRELSTLAMHLGRACRTIRFFARMYAKKGGPESALSALLEKRDRKSTRLNSSHGYISYAVFCLKKKKNPIHLIIIVISLVVIVVKISKNKNVVNIIYLIVGVDMYQRNLDCHFNFLCNR